MPVCLDLEQIRQWTWLIITRLPRRRCFEHLAGSVRKEETSDSGNSALFSLPVDCKYLENSTDSKGSEPDFALTAFFSLLADMFLIAFEVENEFPVRAGSSSNQVRTERLLLIHTPPNSGRLSEGTHEAHTFRNEKRNGLILSGSFFKAMIWVLGYSF